MHCRVAEKKWFHTEKLTLVVCLSLSLILQFLPYTVVNMRNHYMVNIDAYSPINRPQNHNKNNCEHFLSPKYSDPHYKPL